MSDNDLDDDLLALIADDPPLSKKRKSKPSSSSAKSARLPEAKKRKKQNSAAPAAGGGGSDMEMSDGSNSSSDAEPPVRRGVKSQESDEPEGQSEEEFVHPFPLEGKYKDERDRERLMAMNELDREAELHDRLELADSIRDRIMVRNMARDQDRKQAKNSTAGRAEKRESTRAKKTTGLTEVKENKMKKLRHEREKRQKRAERKGKASGSEDEHKRRRSPSSGFSSSAESEEGEYSSDDDDRTNKRTGKGSKKGKKAVEETAGQEELRKLCLSRSALAGFWVKPWFEDYVTGAYVRYSLGPDKETRQTVYRLCEITGLGTPTNKPYRLDRHMTDIVLKIQHGNDRRSARMDEVSNSTFTEAEYVKLRKFLDAASRDLPSRKAALKKIEEIQNRGPPGVLTEADIQAILEKKGSNPKKNNPILYRATLGSRVEAARASGDAALLAELEAEFAELTGPPSGTATPVKSESALTALPSPEKIPGAGSTSWAALNERNRKANRDEIRRAELASQEMRKKMAAGGGGEVKIDASARVRTTVRVMHDVRAATPEVERLQIPAQQASNGTTIAPQANKAKQGSKIETIANTIEVDLGDF